MPALTGPKYLRFAGATRLCRCILNAAVFKAVLSIFIFYLKDNIKIPERSASCEDDDEEDEGEAADMEGISLIEWDVLCFGPLAIVVHFRRILLYFYRMHANNNQQADLLYYLLYGLVDACLICVMKS